MNVYSLILSVLIGVSLGSIGSFAALSQFVAERNARLTCQPWQERDSYRSLAGKIDYCKDLPTKTVTW